MARRLASRSRGHSQRRESLWLGFVISEFTLAGANSEALVFTLNTPALLLTPFTIVRTRFLWHVHTDQASADESQQIALGMAVVTEEAAAAGVASVPTPATDIFSDMWFVHELSFDRIEFASAVGFTQPTGRLTVIDSKAMRKVDDGSDLVIVLQNSATSEGTVSTLGGRMLIKLH